MNNYYFYNHILFEQNKLEIMHIFINTKIEEAEEEIEEEENSRKLAGLCWEGNLIYVVLNQASWGRSITCYIN